MLNPSNPARQLPLPKLAANQIVPPAAPAIKVELYVNVDFRIF